MLFFCFGKGTKSAYCFEEIYVCFLDDFDYGQIQLALIENLFNPFAMILSVPKYFEI